MASSGFLTTCLTPDSASVAQSSNQPEQPASPGLSIASGSMRSASSSTSLDVKCRTWLLENIKQLEAKVEDCMKNWEEITQQWEKKYGVKKYGSKEKRVSCST